MNELVVHKLDEDGYPEEMGSLELVIYQGSLDFMHDHVCAVIGFHTWENETRVMLRSLVNGKELERVRLSSVKSIKVPEVLHAELPKVETIPSFTFATNVEGYLLYLDEKAHFVSEADKAAQEYLDWKRNFELVKVLEKGI